MFVMFFVSTKLIFADSSQALNHGLEYLQSKQENTGKISGFGGESQWAAIAFSVNDHDVSVIRNADFSLRDFLLSNQPSTESAATEWERHILSIVAIGADPSNFGGLNYIEHLQALAKEDQLGEISLLNDDIFGLLSLSASGPLADPQITQNSLNFIINHQAADGGFSWSADTTCAWCGSDSNDTAAAIQALQLAKDTGLTHAELDTALEKATQYLLSTQKDTGGFGYDFFSEADGSSTAWALMALHSLGLSDSPAAQIASDWLINNQESDGGFHWMSGYGSDTSTTSYAVIALSGHSLVPHIFSLPLASPSPELQPSPSPATIPVSPTPTVMPSISPQPSNSSSPTPTPSPIPSPSSSPTSVSVIASPTAQLTTPKPKVLGSTSEKDASLITPSAPLVSSTSTEVKKKISNERKAVFKVGLIIAFIIVVITGAFVIFKIWTQKDTPK